MLQHMQFVAERASREKWAGENKFEVVDFDNKGSPQESVSKLKAAINKHNELNLGNEIVYLNHSAQDPDMTNSKWL